MPRINPVLRQQIAQAYVSHRLNNSELVAVTHKLQEAESAGSSFQEAQQLLKDFRAVARDERCPTADGDLQHSIGYLHLDQQKSRLNDEKPWSPYERALYRRLSDSANDPVPLPAQGEDKGSPDFVATVQKHFSVWDGNGDGALTPTELDSVLADPTLAGSAAAAAVTMRRQGPQLATCAVEAQTGVTRQDLDQFLLAGVPENALATFKINRGFASLSKAADKVAPASPLLSENFDPQGVEQGRAGSCVMLSTLASLEENQVRPMFQPLSDGQVRVVFADGQTQTVRDLTLAERLYHAKSADGGRWPGLLEVALGQRIHAQNPQSDGSFRSAANSIPPEEASLALHGQAARKVSLDNLSVTQTRQLLIGLAKGPKPWLAGSRSTPKGQDSVVSVEELHNGIRNNHAYSIQSFDKDQDLVWLRNPWRHGEWVINADPNDDGVFAMPLRDFYSSYRWVGAPTAA